MQKSVRKREMSKYSASNSTGGTWTDMVPCRELLEMLDG